MAFCPGNAAACRPAPSTLFSCCAIFEHRQVRRCPLQKPATTGCLQQFNKHKLRNSPGRNTVYLAAERSCGQDNHNRYDAKKTPYIPLVLIPLCMGRLVVHPSPSPAPLSVTPESRLAGRKKKAIGRRRETSCKCMLWTDVFANHHMALRCTMTGFLPPVSPYLPHDAVTGTWGASLLVERNG